MKYWNKNKDVRRRCWTRVKPRTTLSTSELKRWCQQQSSRGKFYVTYENLHDNFYIAYRPVWWFEQPEDAMVFILKWC